LTTALEKMTLKRIYREIADVRKEDLGDIVLGPSEDDLFLWKGVIPGPEGSCYEGGKFHVDLKLAPDYPCVLSPTDPPSLCVLRVMDRSSFSAPTVIFKTRWVCTFTSAKQNRSLAGSIYHMNISERGNVCIDILKQNWSPALSLFKVMLSLSSLLTDPNPSKRCCLVPTIVLKLLPSHFKRIH